MMKKFLQISALTIAGLLVGFGCYYKYADKNTNNPIEYAYNYLSKEEQNTWAYLNAFDINKALLEAKATELEPDHIRRQNEKAHSTTELSEKTQKLAAEVLASCGIDPASIKIVATERDCAACASETTLLINEKLLNSYSRNAQLFILAHETQHIIYKDYLHISALEAILADKNLSYQINSFNDPLNYYSRFCEFRADANAALKGGPFAQGYLEFTQASLNEGEQAEPNHPSDNDRFALAQEIHSAMQTTA
ncbi:hypothetical protein HYX58_03030 [Candidatus Dependentiae bacterium]|nr:hypothetical protein [Candidatus Dependentiae bacterium]